jgi:hypothetical protein
MPATVTFRELRKPTGLWLLAATVAAAALPAVADEFAPNSVKMFDAAVAHPDSYLIMNGIGNFIDGVPELGAWLWDCETREVYELVETGWRFIFSLDEPRRKRSSVHAFITSPEVE